MPLLAALLLAVQAPLADLPFERIGNRVYLRGDLNGRAVNAVLDTGAQTTVADDALAFANGAKKLQAVEAGGAGAKRVAAYVVSDLKLRLAGTTIDQPIGVVLPLEPLTKMEGRPLQTVLGYDFLRRYRVEIDYAASRVRLFPPENATVPSGATALPVRFVNNHPHVAGRVEIPGLGSQDVTMMLDTGATTAMSLTNRAVRRLDLTARFKDAPEMVTGGGVGGETKGRRVRLGWGEIGAARLDRPVAILDSTEGGATGKDATYDVLVGGEALRRFTLTLDYAHARIFLTPNAAHDEPFVGDRTGLSLMLGDGGYAVRQVVPGSPAEEAGVRVGDVIVAFDGKAPATLEDVRRLLRAATGDLRLALRRDGKPLAATLKTRETIP